MTAHYFDTKTNKVVTKQPEEGIQIVADGAEMTPALEAEIERYKAWERGDDTVGTVTTATIATPENAAEKPARSRKG